MGMTLIYGLVLLLLFLGIAIGLFIYSKKKKSKVGLVISIIMLLFVSLVLLSNTIDEITISKKDIVSDLNHLNIELTDDFIITSNKVTGMPERIQETEIQISPKDKERIMSEIRNSVNFKSFANEDELTNDADTDSFWNSSEIFYVEYPTFYSKEKYTEIDNYPTRLSVSIDKKSNTIRYLRIED